MMDRISMGLKSKSSAQETEFFSNFALKIISVICINHTDNVAEICINPWLNLNILDFFSNSFTNYSIVREIK